MMAPDFHDAMIALVLLGFVVGVAFALLVWFFVKRLGWMP
jgi:hypothetical protein